MLKRIALLAFLCVATLSCGDGATEPPPSPPPPAPPLATTITVNPATATLTALGDSVRLIAQVRDQYGQVMTNVSVNWSSGDASIVTVDASGLARAAGDGMATITASSGSVSGTATVTVAREVAAVIVTPLEAALAPGASLQLTALAIDADSVEVGGVAFAWSSSDESVATVDSTGLVHAVGTGDATITAAADSVMGTATVTVAQAVSAVVVMPSETVLVVGDSVRLSAEARDRLGGEITDALFTWSSSDQSVATVDSTGLVHAVGSGDATITAAADSVMGTATVTVAQAVSAVVVMPSETVLVVGDSVRLSAEARDRHGGDIADASFAWSSSDGSVAMVDTSGLVRAVAEGRATITATSETASGNSELTVAEMSDRGALVAFYRSTGGAQWVDRTNWLTDAPLGDWYGVTAYGGRVVDLKLRSNNLTGVIPPQIEHLSHLRHLILGKNSIEGGIPPGLGNLSRLKNLGLDNNGLSGPIPPELSRLDGLTTLLLGNNRLSGPIPPELNMHL